MATESVGILIEADDQASAKLQQVGDNVDRQVKRIREVGGRAKASSEFIGTLANSLGGTQLGGFAGDLGMLTERISAFSEVSKAGGAGALAFKAGLAAAAAVTSFKIGEAIGNWVFETERWRKELSAAATEAERLNGIFAKRQQKEFSGKREDLSLINDPKQRAAETLAESKRLAEEAAKADTTIGLARQEVARRQAAYDKTWLPESNQKEELAIAQQQLKEKLDKKQAMVEESQALKEIVELEQKRAASQAEAKSNSFIEGLRAEVELTKASKEQRFAIEAAKNAHGPEATAEAEALLRELDALKEKAEAQKKADAEAEKAKQKEIADAERIANLKEKEIQRLEQQRIELAHGKEAAHAYALEMEGLDKDTARRIASEQALLDKQKEKGLELSTEAQAATQGRLLTRGTGGNVQQQMLKVAQNQEQTLMNVERTLQDIYRESKNKGITLEVARVP